MKKWLLISASLVAMAGAARAETTKPFPYSGGIVTFTAPATGTYDFTVDGAQGGGAHRGPGGLGALAAAHFTLTAGQIVDILVGGTGDYGYWGGGGGGGSFVWDQSTFKLMLAAGGGGGGALYGGGYKGLAGTSGGAGGYQGGAGGSGGLGGGGGNSYYNNILRNVEINPSWGGAGGGAGFYGAGGRNGGGSTNSGAGGDTPSGGGSGGAGYVGHNGGFGGGGGASYTDGGGGGGYSGGGGGGQNTFYKSYPGGGGGSFVAGFASNAYTFSGVQSGNGYVAISYASGPVPEPASLTVLGAALAVLGLARRRRRPG